MVPVTLRLADPSDASGLERLAQLDSRRVPPGPHLVAIRDGRMDAAISLTTREVIADPFRRTAELRALLECRAGPARPAGRTAPVAPRPRPRTALAPT